MFAAFLERFAELVEGGTRSAATLEMHRENCALLSHHLNGSTALADLDAAVIHSVARNEKRGRRFDQQGNQRPITNGTLQKRLSTLRAALELARRAGWIAAVPEFPDVPHRYRPVIAYLRNPEELARLCAALPLERAEWVYVAVFTGQHASDVNRLRAFDDADPFAAAPWILIRNTKNRDPAGARVVMATPLVEILRARFEREQLRPGDPLVEPWEKNARLKLLRRVCARLGLMKITANALRHTCASWAAHELGQITPGLQHFLRHRSLEMLQRVYVHALRPRHDDIAAALSAFARRGPKGFSPAGTVPADKEKAEVPGETETSAVIEPGGADRPVRIERLVPRVRRGRHG